jgi:hypothetical protein
MNEEPKGKETMELARMPERAEREAAQNMEVVEAPSMAGVHCYLRLKMVGTAHVIREAAVQADRRL